MSKRVLLTGESWVTSSTHVKGFDFFSSSHYATGADALVRALERHGAEVTHLPGHEAAAKFPLALAELQRFDAVILSDIGANTLLLPPQTFLQGQRAPNRLSLLRDYVRSGGGLLMAGGYLSFQGIYGTARYHRTPVEEVLPVTMHPFDDRLEKPEGVVPTVTNANHPILRGVPPDWPYLLGLNELVAKPDGELLATADGHPLLVVGSHGEGRTAAWASDVGPHWCPQEFVDWAGYDALWGGLLGWLAEG